MPQGQVESATYQPQFGSDGTEENRIWHASRDARDARDALSHQRDNLQRGLELNDSGERVNLGFLLDILGQRLSNGNTDVQQQQPQTSPSSRHTVYPTLAAGLSDELQLPTPRWTALPKNSPPTDDNPLDMLLYGFMRSRQQTASNPDSTSDPPPPSYPSVSSLLNPSRHQPGQSYHSQADPLSDLMTGIISKFPSISELPDRVATLFCMFNVMRWQIHPTQENYERLPDWLRPIQAQLVKTHPAWMDHIPWPLMRDKIVASPQDYDFNDWTLPFTSGLSVNWPYDPADCLLKTSERDEPVMNPVFERHIRRLENWSLGPSFAEKFPELVETTRIKVRELAVSTAGLKTAKSSMGMPAPMS